MAAPNFDGRSVLVLESRRAREMGALVTTYGGRAVIAPALREVPLDSNTEALSFAQRLLRGEIDIVILLTGVGTRALLEAVEQAQPREEFLAALARTKIVVRGPKPLAVLRELGMPAWIAAPEPNTWRELLAALDQSGEPLRGRRVAVQEYGVTNPELIQGLEERGAAVMRVPVYRWALPEDLEPLRSAIAQLLRGELDVAIFTTGMQVAHLLQVAAAMNQEADVTAGLRRMIVASIGPTTSEQLREHGIPIALEASHPKMGFLVREAAAYTRTR